MKALRHYAVPVGLAAAVALLVIGSANAEHITVMWNTRLKRYFTVTPTGTSVKSVGGQGISYVSPNGLLFHTTQGTL